MARFYTIDVVVIQSDVPRSQFPEDELDILAQYILHVGGLLRPLILEETGLEQYSVIDGHGEFYAAMRAYEKDRSAAEMVNAFVVSKKEKEAVLAQLDRLMKTAPIATSPSPSTSSTTDSPPQNSTRLDNIDKRLESVVEQIYEQRRELTDYKAALEKANRDALAKKFFSLLAEVNGLEGDKLARRLQVYNLKKNVIENVVAARRDRGQFADYKELLNSISGLGAAGLVNAITRWEQVNRAD